MWLGAIVFINPVGDFPVNDDWAYAKNVYNLAVNHQFVVDEWPAMTLVSQTLYGSFFVSVFGFSFTTLRLSILVLGMVATLILYRTVLKLSGNNRFLAFTATAGFCFSTLFCALSFSFMTDIFFLSFVIFAFYVLTRYLDQYQKRFYVLFCLCCMVAVLNRQHGLLLPCMMVLPLLWKQKITFKKLLLAFIPFVLCLTVHLGYRFLLRVYQVPHNMQSLGNFKQNLAGMTVDAVHINAGDILLVTGWLLLPVVVIGLLNHKFRTSHIWWLTGITGLVLLLVYKDWVYYPQGNISRFMEIGPRVLKDAVYQVDGGWQKTMVKLLSVISTIGVLFLVIKNKKTGPLYLGMMLFLGAYFLFIAFNQAYFDRYALPFALVLLLLLVPENLVFSKTSAGIVVVLLLGIYCVSVLEVSDHMGWQRTRWKAVRFLENQEISAQQIDGGFEYNGWHKPGKGFEPGKSWWWVKDDSFVIGSTKIKGYKVQKYFLYRRHLPRTTDTIFVLQKQEGQGAL